MTVDDVRLISYYWQDRQSRSGKECELFHIFMNVAIWFIPIKIIFIVDEIIMNPRVFHLHDSHILASPCHIHIKTCYKLHAFFPFCRNKPIVRKYHTNLVFFFIKIFRKCTNNVCKPPGLHKWNAF